MASLRQLTLLMPFDTVAGKLSEVARKRRTYVAYSTKARSSNIYFQAKVNPRKTAASSGEIAQRNKFSTCVAAANTWLEDPTKTTHILSKFRAQLSSGSNYPTLRGYTVARAFVSYDDSTHTCDYDVAFPA